MDVEAERRGRVFLALRGLRHEAETYARRIKARPLRRWPHRLAQVLGTDKAQHGYIAPYLTHLADLRRRRIRVLEIGIGGYKTPWLGGGSLRLWRALFPRSTVHGIDVYPKTVRGRRISTHVANQAEPETLVSVASAHGPFDLIIDDGSHINDHVVSSFRALFPFVRPGGWYVIEDLETAYMPDFGGGPPGQASTIALLRTLLDDVNRASWDHPYRDALPVSEMHMYANICFVRRAEAE